MPKLTALRRETYSQSVSDMDLLGYKMKDLIVEDYNWWINIAFKN